MQDTQCIFKIKFETAKLTAPQKDAKLYNLSTKYPKYQNNSEHYYLEYRYSCRCKYHNNPVLLHLEYVVDLNVDLSVDLNIN